MRTLNTEELEQVDGGANLTLRGLQGEMLSTGFGFGWAGSGIGTILGGPVGGVIGAAAGAVLGSAVGAVVYLSQ